MIKKEQQAQNGKLFLLNIFRLLIVEYIRNFLDININSFSIDSSNLKTLDNINKIIQLNPFNLLLEHFFEFELNNVFQKLFEHLIILLTNNHTPVNLVIFIFEDCKYLEKLIEFNLTKIYFRFK